MPIPGFYWLDVNDGVAAMIPSPSPAAVDWFSPYLFRVTSALSTPLIIELSASSEGLACAEQLQLQGATVAPGEVGSLYFDECAKALYAPVGCERGTWYSINKTDGVLKKLTDDNSPPYLADVLDSDLSTFTYVYVCKDDKSYVAVTRELQEDVPPCNQTKRYNVRVFPNPTQREANIEILSDLSSDMQYVIHDMAGRLISEGKINHPGGTINVPIPISDWASGMYIIRVQDSLGRTGHHKLLVIQ
jgi:hypothetical protein